MRKGTSTKKMTFIGLMAAILCLLGPFTLSIPFSPVPLSLCTLGIYFVIYVLGARIGTYSVILYILLGLAGLPVFSGFTGGVGKLLGPTGGYLIGYLFLAVISGFFIDRFGSSKALHSMILCFLGMLLGTAVCYLFGTLWLSYQLSLTFYAALSIGVLPYLPLDLLKLLIAIFLGNLLKKRLHLVGLL